MTKNADKNNSARGFAYEDDERADATKTFFMPTFPEPKKPLERTGSGDAFTATFVSALILGKSPEEASAYLRSEYKFWGESVKSSGVKLE